MEINVLVEDGLEIDSEIEWLQKAVEKTLACEHVPGMVEISLVVCGQERIQELNRDYRGQDRPTDVLSFSMSEQKDDEEPEAFIDPPDGIAHLGEVIISYPQAVMQAAEKGHSIKREMAVLIIHGALHILGYDHEDEEKAPAMLAREKEILLEVERDLL
ncbi:MAG: rRNA maturation RNase YbeY [Dehalococcoidales bacterium]|nr:rRNA maturation RNase YbeY [Dehalococcoidales bacterium]